MKKNTCFNIAMLIVGLCCVLASILLHGRVERRIDGILIGMGSGLVGVAVAYLTIIIRERINPTFKKKMKIEDQDERNVLIRNRAKALSGDLTQWCIMGIAYVTIFIKAPIWVTLYVVSIFLLYNLLTIFFEWKFQKEM